MKLAFLGQSYKASTPAVEATEMTETATFLGKSYTRKQYTVQQRQRPTSEMTYLGPRQTRTSANIRQTHQVIHHTHYIPHLGNLELAFNPGNTLIYQEPSLQTKAFEDRFSLTHGADGTVVAIVVDGVGENYTHSVARTMYAFGNTQRVLGDIPGLILMQTFEAVAKYRPQRLQSSEGIRGVIDDANSHYLDWLCQAGLGDRLSDHKEQLGGCTFVIAVITSPSPSRDRQVLLLSAGDAVGVAQTATHQLVGTDNQLLATNAVFQPVQNWLQATLAQFGATSANQDMQRAIFNPFAQRWFRNRLTNQSLVKVSDADRVAFIDSVQAVLERFEYLSNDQRREITHQLSAYLPIHLPGYGFFDANPVVVQHLSIAEIPFAMMNHGTVIIATDGCIDSRSPTPAHTRNTLFQTYLDGGIAGLVNYNQTIDKGPEATAIVLRLPVPVLV